MNGCNLTDLGLTVKTELLKRGKEQKWLVEEVAQKTGLYVDSSYMSKILTGKKNSQKIVDAVVEILGLEVETDDQAGRTDSVG